MIYFSSRRRLFFAFAKMFLGAAIIFTSSSVVTVVSTVHTPPGPVTTVNTPHAPLVFAPPPSEVSSEEVAFSLSPSMYPSPDNSRATSGAVTPSSSLPRQFSVTSSLVFTDSNVGDEVSAPVVPLLHDQRAPRGGRRLPCARRRAQQGASQHTTLFRLNPLRRCLYCLGAPDGRSVLLEEEAAAGPRVEHAASVDIATLAGSLQRLGRADSLVPSSDNRSAAGAVGGGSARGSDGAGNGPRSHLLCGYVL